jgi:hypothetical protein
MPNVCPATLPSLINGLCFPSANPCAPGVLQFWNGNAPFCSFFACPPGFTFQFITYPAGILGYCSITGPISSSDFQLVLDSAPCPPTPPAPPSRPPPPIKFPVSFKPPTPPPARPPINKVPVSLAPLDPKFRPPPPSKSPPRPPTTLCTQKAVKLASKLRAAACDVFFMSSLLITCLHNSICCRIAP